MDRPDDSHRERVGPVHLPASRLVGVPCSVGIFGFGIGNRRITRLCPCSLREVVFHASLLFVASSSEGCLNWG